MLWLNVKEWEEIKILDSGIWNTFLLHKYYTNTDKHVTMGGQDIRSDDATILTWVGFMIIKLRLLKIVNPKSKILYLHS